MRFRPLALALTTLIAAAVASPPRLAAQGTAGDSIHWRATKADLDSMARDRSAPAYSKRAQARIRQRDSLRAVVTPPAPAPVPIHAVLISGPTTVVTGKTIQLIATVINDSGATVSRPVDWASAPADVATISATGLLKGLKAGPVLVTASTPNEPQATRTHGVTVTAPPVPPDTVVPVPPDTTTPPVPPDTVTPLPPPTPATIAGAAVATLPLKTPTTPYPVGGIVVPVAAGANLQTAITLARPADGQTVILALAPCATYTGSFTLPARGDATGWVVIRTDLPDSQIGAPGTRMTPARAAAVCLAKILTPSGGASAAIGTAPAARGWRLTGVEISATPAVAATGLNSLVRFGESSGNGQTTEASQPRELVVDRSYVHGLPTMNLRRCLILNSADTEVVDSWLGECHDANGDSQGYVDWNGSGPHRIENNHIESGHQCLMYGGGDPGIPNLVPSDITFRHNYCTRPVAWKGKWQTKTIVETKNARRMLVEGNVLENVWLDAQVGFGGLLKSTNQDGSCVWCITSDVTMRYNVWRNMGSGFNFAANPQGGIPATRFYVTDNTVDNIGVPPFDGSGIPLQMLGALTDIIVEHTTYSNAGTSAISFDGAPGARFVFRSNILPHGTYGVKGSGKADGASTLNYYAPGAVFTANAIIGGGSCSQYPAGNICPAALPSSPPMGADGRPMGADLAKVQEATAGVVDLPSASVSVERARSDVRIPTRGKD